MIDFEQQEEELLTGIHPVLAEALKIHAYANWRPDGYPQVLCNLKDLVTNFWHVNELLKLNELLKRPWQPIATAPKDGTHILGRDALGTFVCYWKDYIEPCWGLSRPGEYCDSADVEPLYWMPIPGD